MRGVADDDPDFRLSAVGCLDRLYSFARSLTRSHAAAEDLVQETYVRALRATNRPADPEGVRPWLFTILHNIWRNERRRRHPESFDTDPHRLERIPTEAATPEEALDLDSLADKVWRSIEALPDAYREVVLLRFAHGLTYRDIAQILDCPAGTVMSRLARARALIIDAVRPCREGRRVAGRH